MPLEHLQKVGPQFIDLLLAESPDGQKAYPVPGSLLARKSQQLPLELPSVRWRLFPTWRSSLMMALLEADGAPLTAFMY